MKFENIVFDCDGVLLDSNQIKKNAFNDLAMSFGIDAAIILNDFHLSNIGASRYVKFAYLIDTILPAVRPDFDINDREKLNNILLKDFSSNVVDKLLKCDVTDNLDYLRRVTTGVNWFVVSGGDQQELNEVFAIRKLKKYFNGGIYGSPRTKYEIIESLLSESQLNRSTLFLGDSRLDHEVAKAFNMDFVFVHQWTEFEDWREYCKKHQIRSIHRVSDLLNL